MFDPTAFENIKVVVEGVIYDHDLRGEILVIDRNDMINLSKLERHYEVAFIEQNTGDNQIKAILKLEAKLENLAAELLASSLSEKKAGCHVTMTFGCEHRNDQYIFDEIQKNLADIWGQSRTIEQQITLHPLKNREKVTNVITVQFNRLIYEEQIEDLTHMVEFMIESIRKLKKTIE